MESGPILGLESWPALQALKEAGRPLVPSTGDQLNGYTKFLVANKIRGYAYPMTTQLSGEAVKQALKAVKGEKVEKKVFIAINGYGPDKIQQLTKPDLSDWWWIGDDQMPRIPGPSCRSLSQRVRRPCRRTAFQEFTRYDHRSRPSQHHKSLSGA